MDNNATGAVPSGIGLKAAYLLRQELQKHQELPSIEQLAMILEDTLRYPGAVVAMRDEEDFHGTSHTRDGVCEFNATPEMRRRIVIAVRREVALRVAGEQPKPKPAKRGRK